MTYDLASYDKNGIATPIRVLPEAEALALSERVTQISNSGNVEAVQALRASPHLLLPWLYDLATRPEVLDAVEQVLGPDLLIWSSQFFTKQPGHAGYVSWHQDSTYWGLEPADICTAWIALTPSVPESGCMQVAPGSHTMEQLPHTDKFHEDNLLSRGQEIEVDVDNMDKLDVVLQPGEMSLHHVHLVHGSEANRAAYPRMGYVIRFIPTSVRQIGGRTRAVLVRGEDTYGHFELTTPETEEMTPEGFALVRDARDRMTRILMADAAQASHHDSHQIRS